MHRRGSSRLTILVTVCAALMLLLTMLPTTPVVVADKATAPTPLVDREDVRDAVLKGLAWLATRQGANGGWEDSLGVTALILTTYTGAGYDYTNQTVQRGLRYIRTFITEEGFIAQSFPNYENAASMIAILGAGDPQDATLVDNITRAQLAIQYAPGSAPNASTWWYPGGWPNYAGIPDVSNGNFAVWALMASRLLNPDVTIPQGTWDGTIRSVKLAQNWPAVNNMTWARNASLPSYGDGGFVYNSARSRTAAGEMKFESYGSITGGGLIMYLGSGHGYLNPETVAARDWLEREYNLAENPRMDGKGLYYYLWAMARALAMSPQDRLVDSAGNLRDWRSEIANAFSSIQRTDGGWTGNPFTGWREEEPEIAAIYALSTMEVAYLMAPNARYELEVSGASSAAFLDDEGAVLATDPAKGLTVTSTKLTATDPETFRKVWVDITGAAGATATVSAKGTWGQGRVAATSAQVGLGDGGAWVFSATGGFAGPFGIILQPFAGGPALKTSAGETLSLRRGEVNIINITLTETTGNANATGVDLVFSLASNATVSVSDQRVTVPKGGTMKMGLTVFVPADAPEGDAGFLVVSSDVSPPVRVAVKYVDEEDEEGAPPLYWVLILVLFIVVMALIALPAVGRRRAKGGGDKPQE